MYDVHLFLAFYCMSPQCCIRNPIHHPSPQRNDLLQSNSLQLLSLIHTLIHSKLYTRPCLLDLKFVPNRIFQILKYILCEIDLVNTGVYAVCWSRIFHARPKTIFVSSWSSQKPCKYERHERQKQKKEKKNTDQNTAGSKFQIMPYHAAHIYIVCFWVIDMDVLLCHKDFDKANVWIFSSIIWVSCHRTWFGFSVGANSIL